MAKDDDPQPVNPVARIQWVFEQPKSYEAMVDADELDIHLLPNVGCAWMPHGTIQAVMTPGKHSKHYLAGALNLPTAKLLPRLKACKTKLMYRDLLFLLVAIPRPRSTHGFSKK